MLPDAEVILLPSIWEVMGSISVGNNNLQILFINVLFDSETCMKSGLDDLIVIVRYENP